ncbi:MAG: S41 family peptidase [Chitinophagales bacterium]
MQKKKSFNVYLPFIFAMVLALGVFMGYLISLHSLGKEQIFTDNGESTKFDKILDYIEVHYVDTLDRTDIEEEAINELLSNLDPHSFYIPPREFDAVQEDLQGNFEGIGVEFFIVNDTITIVTPIAGGPSEALGILAGDKIVAIEDTVVAGIGIENSDVVAKLRGERGTKVNVTILRNGQETDYTIVRDKIPLYSVDVSYMVTSDIGLIKINRFSATTYEEFDAGLQKLVNAGAKKLILDLRQNPGGYMGTAVQIADELLAGEKLVVYTEGKAYQRVDYYADRPGNFEQGDVAVLIDEGSASASEILAGAIQDWDRGVVIGRRSYGKGLVQEQFDFQDNSALRLTIARYYIPSGRCIQKPYDTDNMEDYYYEVYDRYDNGEFFEGDSMKHVDSLMYTTQILGREVYGGGGIMPDIFVSADTSLTRPIVNELRSKIPEFVYDYYAKHVDDFQDFYGENDFKNSYKISENLFDEFVAVAKSKGWDGDEMALETKHKDYLKQVLKAFLAKQIFQNEGYFLILNEIDPVVQQAVEELNKGIDLE